MHATNESLDLLPEIKAEYRTLVVATVALTFPVGQTGFQLGADGRVSFENLIVSWIAVTATMVALLVLPSTNRSRLNAKIWILAIPSIWILSRLAVVAIWGPGTLIHPALFVLGGISYALCVPYAIVLIVRIANPDLPPLSTPRLRMTLVSIAVVFFLLGYGIGLQHDLFLSCAEMIEKGRDLPSRCLETHHALYSLIDPGNAS